MKRDPAPGMRPAHKITTWRRYAREQVTAAGFRRDLAATLFGIIDGLAAAWRPHDRLTGPGHDVLAERTGRCEATITRAVGRLADMGLLYTAHEGTVVWSGEATQNMRAEYALTVPEPVRRKRAVMEGDLHRVPNGKRARHAAARSMQRVAEGQLSGLSVPALAAELRCWFEAGWTPAEVLRGIDYAPSGAWTYTTAPRDTRAWLRHRLSFHKDGTGQPVPSPSQQTAARRAEAQAERERRRGADRATGRGAPKLTGTARSALAAAKAAATQARSQRRYRAGSSKVENADPSESSTLVESPSSRARRTPTSDAARGAAWTSIEERIERMRLAQAEDDGRATVPLHHSQDDDRGSPHPFLGCSLRERPTPLPASASA